MYSCHSSVLVIVEMGVNTSVCRLQLGGTATVKWYLCSWLDMQCRDTRKVAAFDRLLFVDGPPCEGIRDTCEECQPKPEAHQ